MRLSRPARLLAAWIASFAMVFGALAPVLAQAGYRLSGERIWQELCTTEGVRYVLTEVESEFSRRGLARVGSLSVLQPVCQLSARPRQQESLAPCGGCPCLCAQ